MGGSEEQTPLSLKSQTTLAPVFKVINIFIHIIYRIRLNYEIIADLIIGLILLVVLVVRRLLRRAGKWTILGRLALIILALLLQFCGPKLRQLNAVFEKLPIFKECDPKLQKNIMLKLVQYEYII